MFRKILITICIFVTLYIAQLFYVIYISSNHLSNYISKADYLENDLFSVKLELSKDYKIKLFPLPYIKLDYGKLILSYTTSQASDLFSGSDLLGSDLLGSDLADMELNSNRQSIAKSITNSDSVKSSDSSDISRTNLSQNITANNFIIRDYVFAQEIKLHPSIFHLISGRFSKLVITKLYSETNLSLEKLQGLFQDMQLDLKKIPFNNIYISSHDISVINVTYGINYRISSSVSRIDISSDNISIKNYSVHPSSISSNYHFEFLLKLDKLGQSRHLLSSTFRLGSYKLSFNGELDNNGLIGKIIGRDTNQLFSAPISSDPVLSTSSDPALSTSSDPALSTSSDPALSTSSDLALSTSSVSTSSASSSVVSSNSSVDIVSSNSNIINISSELLINSSNIKISNLNLFSSTLRGVINYHYDSSNKELLDIVLTHLDLDSFSKFSSSTNLRNLLNLLPNHDNYNWRIAINNLIYQDNIIRDIKLFIEQSPEAGGIIRELSAFFPGKTRLFSMGNISRNNRVNNYNLDIDISGNNFSQFASLFHKGIKYDYIFSSSSDSVSSASLNKFFISSKLLINSNQYQIYDFTARIKDTYYKIDGLFPRTSKQTSILYDEQLHKLLSFYYPNSNDNIISSDSVFVSDSISGFVSDSTSPYHLDILAENLNLDKILLLQETDFSNRDGVIDDSSRVSSGNNDIYTMSNIKAEYIPIYDYFRSKLSNINNYKLVDKLLLLHQKYSGYSVDISFKNFIFNNDKLDYLTMSFVQRDNKSKISLTIDSPNNRFALHTNFILANKLDLSIPSNSFLSSSNNFTTIELFGSRANFNLLFPSITERSKSFTWSKLRPLLPNFRDGDFFISSNLDNMTYNKISNNRLNSLIFVKHNEINVPFLTLYNGEKNYFSINMNGELDKNIILSGRLEGRNYQIGQILSLLDLYNINASTSLTGNFSTKGGSSYDLASNFSGNIEMLLKSVRILGFSGTSLHKFFLSDSILQKAGSNLSQEFYRLLLNKKKIGTYKIGRIKLIIRRGKIYISRGWAKDNLIQSSFGGIIDLGNFATQIRTKHLTVSKLLIKNVIQDYPLRYNIDITKKFHKPNLKLQDKQLRQIMAIMLKYANNKKRANEASKEDSSNSNNKSRTNNSNKNNKIIR